MNTDRCMPPNLDFFEDFEVVDVPPGATTTVSFAFDLPGSVQTIDFHVRGRTKNIHQATVKRIETGGVEQLLQEVPMLAVQHLDLPVQAHDRLETAIHNRGKERLRVLVRIVVLIRAEDETR